MILSTFGEIALLAYLNNIYPVLNWQLIMASLLIVIGILMIINMWILKSEASKENKLIFYSVIINPGASTDICRDYNYYVSKSSIGIYLLFDWHINGSRYHYWLWSLHSSTDKNEEQINL